MSYPKTYNPRIPVVTANWCWLRLCGFYLVSITKYAAWSCVTGSESVVMVPTVHIKLTGTTVNVWWQHRQSSQGLSGLCTAPALQSSPQGQKCHHIHHSCSRTTHTVAMVISHFFPLLCKAKQWWVCAEVVEETKETACTVFCMFQSVCM